MTGLGSLYTGIDHGCICLFFVFVCFCLFCSDVILGETNGIVRSWKEGVEM